MGDLRKLPIRLNLVADAARRALPMSIGQLYLAYYAMGGNEPQDVLGSFLAGTGTLPPGEFDFLAAVINEESASQGANHPVPVSALFPLDPGLT